MVSVSTAMVPDLVQMQYPETTTAVVIDILRASTTMVTTLAHGATEIWPCLEIEQAERIRAGDSRVLLGGERGGLPIAGFDFGNSPAEYSRERVEGRAVAFTTTNGTRALDKVRGAAVVVVGAFVNASAVLKRLEEAPHLVLACAGTGGRVTREDILFAGWLAWEFSQRGASLDDASAIARDGWLQAFGEKRPNDQSLAAELRKTQGGRNLIRLGLETDIQRVATWDAFSVVPELEASTGRLRRP